MTMKYRDVMEISTRFSEGNANIENRICPEMGEKIPDDMPMWRWRRRRNKKPLDSTAKNAAGQLVKEGKEDGI